jgi:hypothetical protein
MPKGQGSEYPRPDVRDRESRGRAACRVHNNVAVDSISGQMNTEQHCRRARRTGFVRDGQEQAGHQNMVLLQYVYGFDTVFTPRYFQFKETNKMPNKRGTPTFIKRPDATGVPYARQ